MRRHVVKLIPKTCPVILLLVFLLPKRVDAYVDPGTTAMLSQLLYVLFYGLLAVFLYSIRYIKQIIANLRRYLFKTLPKNTE